MPPYQRVRALTPETAAYIAGLIDGEGTIMLGRTHANENRRLVVSIANTELPLLQFVLDHVGAGKITRKRISSEHHTPSYCYTISSIQALELLQQIQPFVRSYKRRRADLALLHYKTVTPRNGKYSENQLAARARFEKAFLDIKAQQCRFESARGRAQVKRRTDEGMASLRGTD